MVAAVAQGAVSAADRADALPDAASHADLLFDARLDFQNQVAVGFGAHHVGPGHQRAVRLAQRVVFPRKLLHRRLIDSGLLVLTARLVVADAGLAHKQSRQLLQGGRVKLFQIAVDLIVAQHHPEAVQLLGGKFSPGHAVDLFQLLRCELQPLTEQAPRFLIVHPHLPPPEPCPPVQGPARFVWPACAAVRPWPAPPRRSC